MAWTYSGDPENSDRDAVRFRIGDTDPNDPGLTDAEVDYLLVLRGSVGAAALAGATQLAVRYARLATEVRRGSLRISYRDRAESYGKAAEMLAQELGESSTLAPAGIIATGTTFSAIEEAIADDDRRPTEFAIGMHDGHPE